MKKQILGILGLALLLGLLGCSPREKLPDPSVPTETPASAETREEETVTESTASPEMLLPEAETREEKGTAPAEEPPAQTLAAVTGQILEGHLWLYDYRGTCLLQFLEDGQVRYYDYDWQEFLAEDIYPVPLHWTPHPGLMTAGELPMAYQVQEDGSVILYNWWDRDVTLKLCTPEDPDPASWNNYQGNYILQEEDPGLLSQGLALYFYGVCTPDPMAGEDSGMPDGSYVQYMPAPIRSWEGVWKSGEETYVITTGGPDGFRGSHTLAEGERELAWYLAPQDPNCAEEQTETGTVYHYLDSDRICSHWSDGSRPDQVFRYAGPALS